MKRLVTATAAVLAMISAPIGAQQSSTTEADTPLTASADIADQGIKDEAARAEKKICKTDRTTGSLTRRTRTCMTQREWTRLAEGTRNWVGTLERDANQAQAQGACAGAINGCVR